MDILHQSLKIPPLISFAEVVAKSVTPRNLLWAMKDSATTPPTSRLRLRRLPPSARRAHPCALFLLPVGGGLLSNPSATSENETGQAINCLTRKDLIGGPRQKTFVVK